MTNTEFYEIKEKIAEHAIVMLTDCKYDQTKISPSLWYNICQLVKKIEEYV